MMHNIDIDVVEMTMDVMKYAINRITKSDPEMGLAISEEELKEKVGETITDKGIGGVKAFELFREVLVKHTVSIDNPKHLAFVPAAPTRAAILFDLVTAASSIHGSYWMEGAGGIFCENEAMSWIVSLTGLPEGSFGVFTSGGTAANLSAIVTAREAWRSNSKENKLSRGIILCSSQAHSSVKSMAKIIDADIIAIKTQDPLGSNDLNQTFKELSTKDQDRVFAVVASAGTTNAGIIDSLDEVALFCSQHNLWMHVDAAYGGGALMSDTVRGEFKGIELADSITIDPHKWFFAPYDCGAIIYKNPELAKNAHSQHGSYLEIFNQKGMEGFNPSDYQIQLTRRLRGLPLWFSLAMHGTERYKKAVNSALSLAAQAAKMIEEDYSYLSMVRPVSLSVVLFKREGWTSDDYRKWTLKNLEDNVALVTPTYYEIDGKMESIARFCFINPETDQEDIREILDSMN
jgi:glutamate/tyrosine decarboxylase-like PLP-dependent enzyme